MQQSSDGVINWNLNSAQLELICTNTGHAQLMRIRGFFKARKLLKRKMSVFNQYLWRVFYLEEIFSDGFPSILRSSEMIKNF